MAAEKWCTTFVPCFFIILTHKYLHPFLLQGLYFQWFNVAKSRVKLLVVYFPWGKRTTSSAPIIYAATPVRLTISVVMRTEKVISMVLPESTESLRIGV